MWLSSVGICTTLIPLDLRTSQVRHVLGSSRSISAFWHWGRIKNNEFQALTPPPPSRSASPVSSSSTLRPPQHHVPVPDNHGPVVWKRGHVFCSGKERGMHQTKNVNNLPQISPSRSAVARRQCERFYLCSWLHCNAQGAKTGRIYISIFKWTCDGVLWCSSLLIPSCASLLRAPTRAAEAAWLNWNRVFVPLEELPEQLTAGGMRRRGRLIRSYLAALC